MADMEQVKLSELELQIMKVLWDSPKSMTNAEIAEQLKDTGLSLPSVAQVVKRLLKRELIEVGDYILAGNVYAREFRPCLTREAYILMELRRLQKLTSSDAGTGWKGIFAAFLQTDDEDEMNEEEIAVLEQFIRDRKEK